MSTHLTKEITSDFFSLTYLQKQKEVAIILTMRHLYLSTSLFPNTSTILQQKLPSIFSARCFNDEKLPISQELLHTEIGHLFEHILLEYLCITKLTSGAHSAIFNGETWWKKKTLNPFHISIDMQKEDAPYFPVALANSIKLLEEILVSNSFGFPVLS